MTTKRKPKPRRSTFDVIARREHEAAEKPKPRTRTVKVDAEKIASAARRYAAGYGMRLVGPDDSEVTTMWWVQLVTEVEHLVGEAHREAALKRARKDAAAFLRDAERAEAAVRRAYRRLTEDDIRARVRRGEP
jgi:hypothetical protein